MVAVTNLLVLACVWTAVVAVPVLQEACKSIKIGKFSGKAIRLDEVKLKELIADWQVLIPDIPGCPNGPVGVKALVCDYDVEPNAYFETMNKIVVRRKGGLLYPGSITLTVYCGNQQHQNNQPWLQNNQLYLSNNLPWQTNQDVAHLYGQSPLSLSPLKTLGLASQSLLGQSSPQSLWGQSSLPSLSAVPLSQGQSSLDLNPLSLLDLSHNPLLGLSKQSALPSLNHSPLSLLDQSHNRLLGQSPLQLLNLGQSPQLLSSQPLLGQAFHQLSGQPPLLLGQSSLPLLQLEHLPQPLSSQSSLPLSAQSPLLLGQSPLLLGQSSLPPLGHSPQNFIASL